MFSFHFFLSSYSNFNDENDPFPADPIESKLCLIYVQSEVFYNFQEGSISTFTICAFTAGKVLLAL